MRKIMVLLIVFVLTLGVVSCTSINRRIHVTAQDLIYEYDGNHVIFSYEVKEDVELEIKYYSIENEEYLTHTPIDIGEYRVELFYSGDETYSDFSEQYTIKIIKKGYTIEALNMVIKHSGIEIPFNYSTDDVEFEISYCKLDSNDYTLDIPTEVGNYKVKIKTFENEVYRETTKNYYLTIVDDNEVILANQEYDYTGESLEFIYTNNDENVEYSLEYYFDGELMNSLPIFPNSYDVLLKIKKDDKIIGCFYTLQINKLVAIINGSDLEIPYTGEVVPFQATLSTDGDLAYYYSIKDKNEFLTTIPSSIGIYDVKVVYSGSNIYNESEKIFQLSIIEVEEEIKYEDSGMDYTENTNIILNPEKGFYQSFEYKLTSQTNSAIWKQDYIARYLDKYKLFHLRFGLEAFSTNAGGTDSSISSEVLNGLRETLKVFRSCDATVIIRFSYNVTGAQINDDYIDAEPSIELVLQHVGELSSVINEFKDVICSVETGMLGPWGEQHSTTLGDSSTSNATTYYKLVEKWLNSLDKEFKVTVRRPLYFMYWANNRYGVSLTANNISTFDYSKIIDEDLYRVGCFNDGYLGSSTDLGTFKNRSNEIKWLQTQAQYTLYGGEVVADDDTGGIGDYNNFDYIVVEAYKTHTSYLNYGWNYDKVISVWEKSIYDGNDTIYKNNSSTDYDYIANHLGYNFVLTESKIAQYNNSLLLKGTIVNNGFGNVTNKKKVELILKSSTNTYYFNTDMDVTTIFSQDDYNYDFAITLGDIVKDNYDIYIKISDINELTVSNLRTIRFCNNDEYWNKELGANYLGSIQW